VNKFVFAFANTKKPVLWSRIRDCFRRLPMITAVVRGCLRQAVCLWHTVCRRLPFTTAVTRQLATDEINLSKVQCQGITPSHQSARQAWQD